MKLSKSQQDVVDRIQSGYKLFYGGSSDWLRKDRASEPVWKATTKALLRKKIIESDIPGAYRLTEQYKTAPAGQQETK